VRGRLGEGEHVLGRHRFSPACAGNTFRHENWYHQDAVQPRVCGEHASPLPGERPSRGSAPRVRGTLENRVAGRSGRRFSPACAGNTKLRLSVVVTSTVQPRVCGEHIHSLGSPRKSAGSAPRVRGTPIRRPALEVLRRFSPACAGNTITVVTGIGVNTVQPRVCGEHDVLLTGPNVNGGSAPRVRGTLLMIGTCVVCDRFSPACAGNTVAQSIEQLLFAVQPRVCGEHLSSVALPPPLAGSAPRVRGTRDSIRCVINKLRFSPACAGNTRHLVRFL